MTCAIINLTGARDVISMSRLTSTPIQTVPSIMLYFNGRPLAKFTGKKNVPALQSFITKALQHAPQTTMKAPPPSQGGFMPQQHGMYGSGGYHHPQLAPQQGQSGINQQGGPHQSGRSKFWMPEIGKAPSLNGVVKGDGTNQYAYLNDLDEEDEQQLLLPGQVTPHNVPWESNYKRLGTVD